MEHKLHLLVARQASKAQRNLVNNKITKWLLMLTILFSSNYLYSQGNNWKLDGNSNSNNASFLGTTNSFPLQFRTNNQTRFTIGNTGNYTFHTLSGNSNALMLLNNNGEAYRLNFSQNNNDVLTGNGTWQSINTLVPQYWQQTNSGLYTSQAVVVNNTITATGIQILHKIEADTIKGVRKVDINGNITLGEDGAYKGITAKIEDLNINSKPGYDFNTILNANTNGNVGIGTSNPQAKLDVGGDARVSNSFLVGGNTQLNGALILPNAVMANLTTNIDPCAANQLYLTDNNMVVAIPDSIVAAAFDSLGCTTNISTAPTLTWRTIGNNATAGSFIGTTNNQDLRFRTNNQQRMVIKTDGNIGVGTSNPQAKLHIVHQHTAIRFERSGYKTYDIRQSAGNSLSFVKVDNPAPGAQNPIVMYLADTGNVGINAGTSPLAKLHVNGNVMAWDAGVVYMGFSSTSPLTSPNSLYGNGERGLYLHNGVNDGWNFIRCVTSTGDKFMVKGNGTVYAKEYRATMNNFPDYVFDENYELRSIKEVEKYIKTYKHLPGIPSAKEAESEEGVNLGELQRKMLEKIEEMMLYIIELKNENEALKNDIAKLKN
jgi:hypothetical protein